MVRGTSHLTNNHAILFHYADEAGPPPGTGVMRTRKENKEKRFSYSADVYGLSSDEESDDRAARRVSRGDERDDNFDGVAGNDDNHEDDALDEEDEEEVVEEISDDEDFDDDNVSGDERSLRKKESTKKQKLKPSVFVHQVAPYPTDIRQTRIYVGLLKRWTRHHQLADLYYGPNEQHLGIVYDMMRRWLQYHVLPARSLSQDGGVMASPWLAEGFERRQEERYLGWLKANLADKQLQQRTHPIAAKHAQRFVTREDRELRVLLGPHTHQLETTINYGKSLPISESGAPATDTESQPDVLNGWLFDVGGLVLNMKWAPSRGQGVQVLAMAIIPHSDQAYRETDDDSQAEEKNDGCVQLWRFTTTRDSAGVARPSSDAPQLFSAVCFGWGRPKRLEWCPVPLRAPDIHGLLAILSGDGQVRVISVARPEGRTQSTYDWIEEPIATLGLTDEYSVAATCLTWVNTNRLCLGHSDGSISLWSICPCQLLARHPVHISQILDISSGYPSYPYMIASTPVGGCPTLTDLNLPSVETTYIPLPGAVSFQPNLMDWNDHLQGYFSIHPTPSPTNTVVGFTHVRYYVQSRTVFTGPSQPICVSSGTCHPFVLVGSADGSVWAFNALKAIMKDRGDEVFKLKVFEHEFRPAEKIPSLKAETTRGVSRILQGFLPETNYTGRTDYQRGLTEARLKNKKANTKKRSNRGRKPQGPVIKDDIDLDDEDLAAPGSASETRFAIHEPLTRISAVAWNPNIEFGWWAAAAMGSGLVRVMDLGVDREAEEAPEPIDVDD